MSTSASSLGEHLITSKEAAKVVGYSHDYVSRLAREGQVTAERIGRQWCVDLASLRGYIERNKLEQAARQEALSEQRKQDLLAKSQQAQRQEVVVTLQDARPRQLAVVHSFAVLMVGLLTGSFMFAWGDLFTTQLQSVAITPADNMSAQVAASQDVESEPVARDTASAATTATTSTSSALSAAELSLLLARASSTEKMARLVALHFSDVVEVEFTSATSGVLQPQFGKRKGERYHFMVPVEETEHWMETVAASSSSAPTATSNNAMNL